MTEKARAHIYRILLAAQPLIAFYGVASNDEVALWLAVASAILGTGLASANTSTATAE